MNIIMLSERDQYQGKAGFFQIEFSEQYFLKYWQIQTKQFFAHILTYS